MAALNPKRNFYRTRTAYSINRTNVQPIVSKLQLDVQTHRKEAATKVTEMSTQQKSLKQTGCVLDRIINKLKQDNKDQDILLLITPASRHAKLFKLHAIQRYKQIHLGMCTVTEAELSHLKASNAFHSYCIVFATRYVNLVQNQKIHSLIKCLDRKSCSTSKELALQPDNALSNTSSAGDHAKNETLKTMKFHSSFMQTEPDEREHTSFSLNDIYALMETINYTLQPSMKDIKSFFYMAEQLNFSLVVRPELLWKTAAILPAQKENNERVLVAAYLPGSSYLGSLTLRHNDLLQALDLYPKLLLTIHVIEDVFQITPLPRKFILALKTVLDCLKLELLYDVIGEFVFDCYKNFTCL